MAIAKKTLVFAAAAVAALLLLAAAPASAGVTVGPRRTLKNNNNNNQNDNNNQLNSLSAPTITCFDQTQDTITLEVCANGDAGAPNGVKILFEELADLIDAGGFPCPGQDANPELCTAKIVSALGEGDCTTVVIGASSPGVVFKPASCSSPLACGTEFSLIAFALGNNQFNASDFSTGISCSTSACLECTGNADCDLGFVCTDNQCVCAAGSTLNAQGQCICDIDFISTTGRSPCTACAAGTFTGGLTGQTSCPCTAEGQVQNNGVCSCPTGSTLNTAGTECVCNVNFFGENGIAPCTACPAGSTQPLTGQEECDCTDTDLIFTPTGCVECLEDTDCAAGFVCNANNVCVLGPQVPCKVPAAGANPASCGVCLDTSAFDGPERTAITCDFYFSPIPTGCSINAGGGGGSLCGTGSTCFVIADPNAVRPNASGVCAPVS